MATVADAPNAQEHALECLAINPLLFAAVKDSVENALGMCDTKIRCVGVSAMPTKESGMITGMIGVHGKVSGFISVNMAERFVISAVEGLLEEKFGDALLASDRRCRRNHQHHRRRCKIGPRQKRFRILAHHRPLGHRRAKFHDCLRTRTRVSHRHVRARRRRRHTPRRPHDARQHVVADAITACRYAVSSRRATPRRLPHSFC